MTELFIKRNAVVSAERFDMGRDDQGVDVLRTGEDPPQYLGATMQSRGRMVSVRDGDILVTDAFGCYPCDEASFAGLYQPLNEVLEPALSETAVPERVAAGVLG